jgi:hypothetical protein
MSSAVPPVVLAAGWTIAASLQSRPYDPVADTVSALAGTGVTDRWLMTLAFALAGACEIMTGLALRPARAAGRFILMTGGIAGVLVAGSPVHTGDGAPGSHILWAVVGLAALAVWPVAASHRGPAVPWALRPEASARVAVLLLVLLAWFGLELLTSAGHAGLAERVLGEAQAAWPFVVVMSCRHQVAPPPTLVTSPGCPRSGSPSDQRLYPPRLATALPEGGGEDHDSTNEARASQGGGRRLWPP